MAHSHDAKLGKPLLISLAFTLIFVAVEGTAGIFSNSLALLSDAGHNLSDAIALVFSAFALWLSLKPSDDDRTFGYHRAGILAALANALSLIGIALWIFWEAFHRLRHPEPVQSGPVIWVATLAIVLNGVISFSLRHGAKSDLNVRSAYLHMLGDAISACGVVVAGLIVRLTGFTAADPIASILIGVFILWSSWQILEEAIDVLMEGVPKGLSVSQLTQAITDYPQVLALHDFHVWSVSLGKVACSFHLVVREQNISQCQTLQSSLSSYLKSSFGILHTTIQLETEECGAQDGDCMKGKAHFPSHDDDHGHDHAP